MRWLRHDAVVDDDAEFLGWAIVANVADVTAHGPGAEMERSGTRHFLAGTKVWVMPPQWGDAGDSLMVVGKHRGRSGGFVRMVLPRRHLTNFRVTGVYSPAVNDEMSRPWRDTVDGAGARRWQSREEAEQLADLWNSSVRAQ